MKKLYVLYDHTCGLCCRAARWLREEPKYVEIEALPANSPRAGAMFPSLCGDAAGGAPGEVLAISDTGDVYRGTAAWIMCLYALRRHRALALRLARPGWQPMVSVAIGMLSEHRGGLSRLLAMAPEHAAAAAPRDQLPWCADGACDTTERLKGVVERSRAAQ